VKTGDNHNKAAQDGERALLSFTLEHEITFMCRSANEQSKMERMLSSTLFHRADLMNAVICPFACKISLAYQLSYEVHTLRLVLAWLVIRTRGRSFGVPSEQKRILANNNGYERTSPSQFTLRSRVHVIQEFCLLQQFCGFFPVSDG
jgi:hypothetical protein